jgi:CheY-like chemotaxis protein
MARTSNIAEQPKLLLVDDNKEMLMAMGAMFGASQFEVTTANSAAEALHFIDTKPFDVLLTDLHMPEAGDGFTVVSAMRHTNPSAVTLVFSGYPALQDAANAILSQADDVLLKPMPPPELIAIIRGKLEKRGPRKMTNTERVASILERDVMETIKDWLDRVDVESELTCVPLSKEQHTGHLPKLIQELVHRLRVPRELGTKQASEGAVLHGKIRQSQGYSIPMIIEESRILQVSIFHTLQKNLRSVDFSLLLADVMTIADECDSQLKQTIISFTKQVEQSV